MQVHCPKARQADLLVEHVGDEIVVYDQARHEAHSLNRQAADVWRLCDGATSTEQIAQRLAVTDDVVAIALDELRVARLLHGDTNVGGGVDRRGALRRLAAAGVAAVAIPAVLSIAAPTSAMAASQGLPPDPGPD